MMCVCVFDLGEWLQGNSIRGSLLSSKLKRTCLFVLIYDVGILALNSRSIFFQDRGNDKGLKKGGWRLHWSQIID